MPLALLNGTSVDSGCRVLTSPLDLGTHDRDTTAFSCRARPTAPTTASTGAPALSDLDAYLCRDHDLRRSTAALLSARFVYVSPSGRLTRCGNTGEHAYVVDGGYVETSADLTVYDLYQQVKPLVDCHNRMVAHEPSSASTDCSMVQAGATRPILPVLIQIDNGYSTVATAAAAGGRPKELLVPLQGYLAVASSTEAGARQRAYDAFGGNYRRVANVPRPGVQAPLGWVLSTGARDDLDHQLDQATSGVRAWLETPPPR